MSETIKKTYHLLIVEDQIRNVEILKETLTPQYQLSTVNTGMSALEIMTTNPPDLILTNAVLPDMHSEELCKRMKNDVALQLIPVIIMSTCSNKKEALKAEADDILVLPIEPAELIHKIFHYLQFKNISDALNDSYSNQTVSNTISACMMNTFNPNYSDFNANLFNFLKEYINHIKNKDELPGFIITSVKDADNIMDSTLYAVSGNRLEIIETNLHLEKLKNYTFNESEQNGTVLFQNLTEADPGFSKFQERFHHTILRIVGRVNNYISFHGGDVFIIAFNFKGTVNRYMAETLKSLTLNSHFFKVMQDKLSEIRGAYIFAMHSLAKAVEARDELAGAHVVRVNHYSAFLARQLKLPDKLVTDITNSAQMHDIGKVHSHIEIIRKTEKLMDSEWVQIRLHPEYGAKLLGDTPLMQVARNICLGHHENSDGTGYPHGLKNDDIPIEARIVHLADVYDSLRSPRSYKAAFSHEKSMSIILDGDGRTMPNHFDPDILEIAWKKHPVFDHIYRQCTETETV